MVPNTILWPVTGYLLGSIPFGLIFGKLNRKDLRKEGSGNIGATNVARVVGKKWGLATLILDVLKGLIPVMGCRITCAGMAIEPTLLAITGMAAFLGHCFSIYLGFRGGKGVATAAGVFLGICPWAILGAGLVFAVLVKLFKYVSVGSLSAAIVAPLIMHFLCPAIPLQIMGWSMAAIIWIKHKDNIKRLLKGEEKSFN